MNSPASRWSSTTAKVPTSPKKKPGDHARVAVHPVAGQQRHSCHRQGDEHEHRQDVAQGVVQWRSVHLTGQHLLQRSWYEQVQQQRGRRGDRDSHPEHRDPRLELQGVYGLSSSLT